MNGLDVVLGSRSQERAVVAAEEVAASIAGSRGEVRGLENGAAAEAGDIVVIAVPWDGHQDLLHDHAAALAGKTVIDCVNPLGFDGRGPFLRAVPEGSAAQQAQALLPESRVTAAFHHVSAVLLEDAAVPKLELDVLVLGDDREATDLVCALADVIPGVRGLYGGRLRNAGQVEALTANLIAVNRRYHTHAGIRITGV
jgi:NADPH-dependent F420 reductase